MNISEIIFKCDHKILWFKVINIKVMLIRVKNEENNNI